MTEAVLTLSATQSRRNLLGGLVAAMALSTAAVATVMLPQPTPDPVPAFVGSLAALHDQWRSAQATFDAATERHEQACIAARADYPPPPDIIRRGRPGAVGQAAVLTDHDIDGHVTALLRTWGDADRANRWVEERKQIRDQYLLALDVIDATHGLGELDDHVMAAVSLLQSIEEEIMALPASSLAVVALKLTIWRSYAHLTPNDSVADGMISRAITDIATLVSPSRAVLV